jgi:hypothetical protein
MEEFLSDVDHLRDDVERLDARLARLESSAGKPASQPGTTRSKAQ